MTPIISLIYAQFVNISIDSTRVTIKTDTKSMWLVISETLQDATEANIDFYDLEFNGEKIDFYEEEINTSKNYRPTSLPNGFIPFTEETFQITSTKNEQFEFRINSSNLNTVLPNVSGYAIKKKIIMSI